MSTIFEKMSAINCTKFVDERQLWIRHVEVDDFCNYFLSELDAKLLECGSKNRQRAHIMKPGEIIITIAIYYNYSGMKNFKVYYLGAVKYNLKGYFPIQLSYARFIAILKEYLIAALAFMQYKISNNRSGMGFVDSTSLRVCNNKRIRSHKVFDGFAAYWITEKYEK